jgi:hypothetical protein
MSCLLLSEELEIGGPSFWRVGVMPRALKALYTNHSWEGKHLGGGYPPDPVHRREIRHFDGHLGAYLGGRLAFVAGLVSQRSGLRNEGSTRVNDVSFKREKLWVHSGADLG